MVERQTHLEIALAEAQGVPVHYLQLRSRPVVSMWDFNSCQELIGVGYEIAVCQISAWGTAGEAEFNRAALVSAS